MTLERIESFISKNKTTDPSTSTNDGDSVSGRKETKLDKRYPKTIGRFKIRACIGEGAFGTVYRAYDPQMEREVALKIPHWSTLRSDQHRSRFLREAKALAQLHHPHILPVYESGISETDEYYMASCYIKGKTLKKVNKRDLLDTRLKAKIIRDLAEALGYAHNVGIIHRDVKPENVLIDQKARPYLIDFGLASLEHDDLAITGEGALLGTPYYMAPEQADRENPPQNPALIDQYSLGVVLYELLCNRVPFYGPPEIVLAIMNIEDPPKPRSISPDIPRDLEAICLKAMARDPNERYKDCFAFAEDLRRYLHREPIKARKTKTGERVFRWAVKNPLLATSTLGLVIVSVLTIALLLFALKSAEQMEKERRGRAASEWSGLKANQEKDKAELKAEKSHQLAQQALQRAEQSLQKLKAQNELHKEYFRKLALGWEHLQNKDLQLGLKDFQSAATLENLSQDMDSHVKNCIAYIEKLIRQRSEQEFSFRQHLETGKKALHEKRGEDALKAFQLAEANQQEKNAQLEELLQKAEALAQSQSISTRIDKHLTEAKGFLEAKKYAEAVKTTIEALRLKPEVPEHALAVLKSAATLGAIKALKAEDGPKALIMIDQILIWKPDDEEAVKWKESILKALTKRKADNGKVQIKYIPVPVPVRPPPPPPRRPR